MSCLHVLHKFIMKISELAENLAQLKHFCRWGPSLWSSAHIQTWATLTISKFESQNYQFVQHSKSGPRNCQLPFAWNTALCCKCNFYFIFSFSFMFCVFFFPISFLLVRVGKGELGWVDGVVGETREGGNVAKEQWGNQVQNTDISV